MNNSKWYRKRHLWFAAGKIDLVESVTIRIGSNVNATRQTQKFVHMLLQHHRLTLETACDSMETSNSKQKAVVLVFTPHTYPFLSNMSVRINHTSVSTHMSEYIEEKSEWAIQKYNKLTATSIDIHSWKKRCNMKTMVVPQQQL